MAFDSIHRGKMEQILLAYGLPKETVAAITILYRNTKVKVRSVEKRKISYFVLARYLIQHWISPNQDDISYSARTFISG